MPMPYVESSYPLPDATMFPASALGAVGAVARARALAALVGDPVPDDPRAGRYRAALAAGVEAPPGMPLGSRMIAVRRPEPTVIPTRDTLQLHPPGPTDNPFDALVRHQLHLEPGLPPD